MMFFRHTVERTELRRELSLGPLIQSKRKQGMRSAKKLDTIFFHAFSAFGKERIFTIYIVLSGEKKNQEELILQINNDDNT